MLDNKYLRQHIEDVQKNLAGRGYELPVDEIRALDDERKALQTSVESLQNTRNTCSKGIGQAKARGEDIAPLLAEVQTLGDELEVAKAALKTCQSKLHAILSHTPNILHQSVPVGNDESQNVLIKTVGEKPAFDFEALDHIELGEKLSGFDFKQSAKISGARFSVMQGGIAKLHRALTQFMLDFHVQHHAYQEVYVPYIVSDEALYGTGQLPKFAEDLFPVETAEDDERALYLIPTGEVPVTNLVKDKLLSIKDLPLKYVSHTPCFRSEAGSYGRDTRGLIRQHQFEKVELVQVVTPEQADAAFDTLVGEASAVLDALGLAYRQVTLCSGDVGFSAHRTVDLEVWLPSQNAYREISSCSHFADFQARRLQARYKDPAGQNHLVHTLNGSGLAVGRTLVAVMENYQTAEGRIRIPDVLQPYFGADTI